MVTVVPFLPPPFNGNGIVTAHFDPKQLPTKVTADSVVHASVCELGGNPPIEPFLGAAQMQVLDVAPMMNGSLDVRVSINHPKPLNFGLRILIVNR